MSTCPVLFSVAAPASVLYVKLKRTKAELAYGCHCFLSKVKGLTDATPAAGSHTTGFFMLTGINETHQQDNQPSWREY